MNLISIFFIFLLPANVILLLLFNFNKYFKLKYYIQFIFSYGVAPLSSALIFRYLILLFPEKSSLFYTLIIGSFWIILLILFFKNVNKLKIAYRKLYFFTKRIISFRNFLIYFPIIFMLIIFTFQALVYPIVDGDGARYINQSKAIYTYKNIQWEKRAAVIIASNNEYRFNPMIRPAIPYFVALTFMIDGNSRSYFMYKFLAYYYYLLLYLIFIVLVYTLADKLKKNKKLAIFFGMLFFTFSWALTRTMIFSSKESIIYFFTLLGIYFVYQLINHKKRNAYLEILLGIILGINSFVNLHGIIIGLILLFLLLIFSSLSFWERLKQSLVVFSLYLFFGAFEFILNFKGVFPFVSAKISNFILKIFPVKELKQSYEDNLASIKIDSLFSKGREGVRHIISSNKEIKTIKESNLGLYQVNNGWGIYLKGKLQILTKIGVFGFYFWFFLIIVVNNFKKIVFSRVGKLIVAFIIVYFFLFMDPFNIDKSPLAIVLWGSTKYAELVLLMSLVIVSVYFYDFAKGIFSYLNKYKYKMLISLSFIVLILIIFKNLINEVALKMLFVTIPIYKNILFYKDKISFFYFSMFLFLIVIILSLIVNSFKKKQIAFYIFLTTCILFFIGVPFFITNIGKVPLDKTISDLFLDRKLKLEATVNNNAIYDVYFYAKKILPKNTIITTNFSELYIYNDYFKLTKTRYVGVDYLITKSDCSDKWSNIYSNQDVNLCKKVNGIDFFSD